MRDLKPRNFLAKMIMLLLAALFARCQNDDYSPKPRGYHRIQFPEKSLQAYQGDCPFSFDYPSYAQIKRDNQPNATPCWMDLDFPQFNASLHLSYYPLHAPGLLNELTEDAHTFAFKHTVKATFIDEAIISTPNKRRYGIFYSIGGNTASSAQFYLTDSVSHYLRGALYFNEKPKPDSIQPVLDFLKEDMRTMIKSLEWKADEQD